MTFLITVLIASVCFSFIVFGTNQFTSICSFAFTQTKEKYFALKNWLHEVFASHEKA